MKCAGTNHICGFKNTNFGEKACLTRKSMVLCLLQQHHWVFFLFLYFFFSYKIGISVSSSCTFPLSWGLSHNLCFMPWNTQKDKGRNLTKISSDRKLQRRMEGQKEKDNYFKHWKERIKMESNFWELYLQWILNYNALAKQFCLCAKKPPVN